VPDAEPLVPALPRPDPRRGERARYPFAVELQTRWGDMDFQRHLNNVMLARYYEEARIRFLAAVAEAAGEPFRGVVAAVRLDYLRDVQYPAPVQVAAGVVEVGRTSVRLLQAMFQDDACTGVADVTLVRRGAAGVEPLPDSWRAALAARCVC
jgi:acyl-CoA thioester hydrolase